jgi:hypothetical protein
MYFLCSELFVDVRSELGLDAASHHDKK